MYVCTICVCIYTTKIASHFFKTVDINIARAAWKHFPHAANIMNVPEILLIIYMYD